MSNKLHLILKEKLKHLKKELKVLKIPRGYKYNLSIGSDS